MEQNLKSFENGNNRIEIHYHIQYKQRKVKNYMINYN
jgi:hypothetical protein